MNATLEQPTAGTTRIDPEAVYTDEGVATLFGITIRQLRRWRLRKLGRGLYWFPRPFLRGRTPCWTGETLIAWQKLEQERALI
jgi:hypothetical protein